MAGIENKSRWRIAGVLLLLSGILILAVLAIRPAWHSKQQPRSIATTRPAVDTEREQLLLAQAIQRVLLALIVLVLIFTFAGLAWLRWSRRFRVWLFREPHPPTPADDVWAMYRLPEEPEDTDENDAT
ncbi:MAG: hypothetical protein GXY44_10475 [Phycisphaerales bacterium]|nr:hypothetical protein [Phycisphaerales bacterium]